MSHATVIDCHVTLSQLGDVLRLFDEALHPPGHLPRLLRLLLELHLVRQNHRRAGLDEQRRLGEAFRNPCALVIFLLCACHVMVQRGEEGLGIPARGGVKCMCENG